jgi:SAM-dependent methyltransferase
VNVVLGDALRLPILDASIDVVLASGSLHHTGDARKGIFEVERVLAPGGVAYISLYRSNSYYDWVYRTIGAVARVSARSSIADALVNRLMLLPLFALYFWGGRAAVHRKAALPSYRHLVNYFADQLLNPVVSFHTEAGVRSWANEAGMEVVSLSASHAGALLNLTVRKGSAF